MKLLAWFTKPEPEVPRPPALEYDQVEFDFLVRLVTGTVLAEKRRFSEPTEESRRRYGEWTREHAECAYTGTSARSQARRSAENLVTFGGWVGDECIPAREIRRVEVDLTQGRSLNDLGDQP